MAVTNHERVGKGLELLRTGLGPFVERELKHAVRAGNLAGYRRREIADDPMFRRRSTEWDVAVVLRLIWDNRNDAFSGTLGRSDRSLVSELRDHRNAWAHQEPFSSDDAYRALDSVQRLLASISAPQVREIDAHKRELLRVRFQEQVRSERRRTVRAAGGAGAVAGLKAWREVVNPHQDVASGRYQQAEFAADLWQVFLGEGSDEYRDPVEFFRRTYLTASLGQLLLGAVQRLGGRGGDPVVQLQTNFGGGKTHSMLAHEGLVTGYGATLLRMGLDRVPLWRGNRVSVSQLAEDFARYLYLPRLQRPEVLLRSIGDGVSLMTWEQETFGFAEGFDEETGRYRGLRAQVQVALPDASAPGLLVKPAVARQQLDAILPSRSDGGNGSGGNGGDGDGDGGGGPDPPPPPPKLTRFHGAVDLDPTRVGRHGSQIAEEVIAHLGGLVGVNVTVTLEIEAEIPDGAPEQVVRTVTENSKTLKFIDQAFERE